MIELKAAPVNSAAATVSMSRSARAAGPAGHEQTVQAAATTAAGLAIPRPVTPAGAGKRTHGSRNATSKDGSRAAVEVVLVERPARMKHDKRPAKRTIRR